MTDTVLTPAFLIKATYRLHPDDVARFKELAGEMAKAATQRPGNSFLSAAQDVLDPCTFHLIEGWESQTAFDEHIGSPNFQSVLHKAMQLRIDDRYGALFVVSDIKKLDMPN